MPSPEPNCVFCRIVGGDVPAHVVLDTPDAMGFLDQRPLFPGHVLVVPRPHVETLMDLPDELLAPLTAATRATARAVESAMAADGVFVAANNRVSQSVAHLHLHVVPRRRKDGLRGFFWPRQKYADDVEAAEVAARIAAEMEG